MIPGRPRGRKALNTASGTLASDIQNALNALSSIGGVGGTVTVTQVNNVYTVVFGGSLADQDLASPAGQQITLASQSNGLDVVVVNERGKMQRYWRDDAHHKGWAAAESFGDRVKSPPVMIQGQFGETDETVVRRLTAALAIVHRDRRACLGQLVSDRFADTARAAGDQRDTILQFGHAKTSLV